MTKWYLVLALAAVAALASGCQDKCTAAGNTVRAKTEACGVSEAALGFTGCREENGDHAECTATCFDNLPCAQIDTSAAAQAAFVACFDSCPP